VNLLHAVTLRAAHGDATQAESTLRRLSDSVEHHPFVRATAKLCERALEEAANLASEQADACVSRYVWDDEGKVVSGAPREMADEAIQLVGEMSILLDMNEGRTQKERSTFGDTAKLPHCIQSSRKRTEFFVGCPGQPDCHLGYCPLRAAVDRLSAHRELTRAFCRHQLLHARAKTAKELWGCRVKGDALHAFWHELEHRARY
jgi:hypothetical protein